MFFSKKLQKFENIKHCFFSRKNGFSKGDYESLNCGLGSDDKKETVKNRLDIYHDITKPLISYYVNKGILFTVNGENKIDNVFSNIIKKL